MVPHLKYYKTTSYAHSPQYGTRDAACFDVCASLRWEDEVQYYTSFNEGGIAKVVLDHTLVLYPHSRYLIPTNLIFDIPQGYSLRAHPRSGLSFKYGLSLFNCEGVIDSDYVNPVFITLVNTSERPYTLENGMRIAQFELVSKLYYHLTSTDTPPFQKTDRTGGFGSTGV